MKTGSDSAFAMAMGHVVLREYYWGEPAEFFVDYTRRFTDFPFLVTLAKRDGEYYPGCFLNVKDFGRKEKHAEFKHFVIDEKTNKLVIPNGTMGETIGVSTLTEKFFYSWQKCRPIFFEAI